MVTAAVVYWVSHFFNITLQIRNICVLLAPWFASNTAIVTYLLTKEVHDSSAGLIAAGFIAIVPGIFLHFTFYWTALNYDSNCLMQVIFRDLWLDLTITKPWPSLRCSLPTSCG